MNPIKICLVQSVVSPSFEENLKSAEESFRAARKRRCDIICFPELFLSGPLSRGSYTDALPKHLIQSFSSLSKKYRIYSIMGSIVEKRGKRFYNTSYIFDPLGKIMGKYDKKHLTRGEKKWISPGTSLPVFHTSLGVIGIQICRDLLYPEDTRILMRKGAQIIFCPSFWASRSSEYSDIYNKKYFDKRSGKSPKEVDSLVSARGIENAIVFCYVNAAGKWISAKKNSRSILLGRSQIGVPFYGTSKILPHNRKGELIFSVPARIVQEGKAIYLTHLD